MPLLAPVVKNISSGLEGTPPSLFEIKSAISFLTTSSPFRLKINLDDTSKIEKLNFLPALSVYAPLVIENKIHLL